MFCLLLFLHSHQVCMHVHIYDGQTNTSWSNTHLAIEIRYFPHTVVHMNVLEGTFTSLKIKCNCIAVCGLNWIRLQMWFFCSWPGLVITSAYCETSPKSVIGLRNPALGLRWYSWCPTAPAQKYTFGTWLSEQQLGAALSQSLSPATRNLWT